MARALLEAVRKSQGGRIMTAGTQRERELALKCIQSALASLDSLEHQAQYDGAAVRAAEPALVEATAGLQKALALVGRKPDLRVVSTPEELEPWMEQAHDSTPR
jgi:hypothetical protein